MELNRRQTLAFGAALPLAAGSLLPAAAVAQEAASTLPTHRHFRLGDFRVIPLLAGSRPMENPQETFGMNVGAEEFAEVSAAHFISTELSHNFFTPVLVDTGAELILFDTGLDPAGVTGALAAAGHAPDEVTHVVLTHMHGDHIGGMTDAAGDPTFANAVYVTGAAEFDFWAGAGNDGFEARVRPFAEAMTMIAPGADVRGGITAVDAAGHTPGHMAYMLESAGQQLLLMADTANHHVWSLGRPDWEVRFDADKAQAAATRRRLLGMAAAERIPVIGYHMPFPGAGFIEAEGEGFRFVPVSYQLF